MSELVTAPLTKEKWLESYAPAWMKDANEPESMTMCTQCKANAEMEGKAWPQCGVKKSKKAPLNHQLQFDAMMDSGLLDDKTTAEKIEMSLESDPVSWAMTEFLIDGKPWMPRWYQALFMRCTATKRAALWGRRSGKSECMLVLCLWYAMFRVGEAGDDREYYVQIFVNSEQLAKKHYDEMFKLINKGRTLHNMVHSKEKGKRIQLNNNVTISFNVLSMKQVGQEAHMMWFDEAAFYESDEHFAHATAIKLSRPQTPLIMTSNSSGFRGTFYEFCHNNDTYLLQLPSYVNPEWDMEMELFSRQQYSAFEYEILIKAEWGESASGVYKPGDIVYCLKNFQYSYQDIDIIKPPGVVRVLGNDWNESANGVHFVIVEMNPKYQPEGRPVFRTIHKSVVTGHEFNHEEAVAVAKRLMVEWDCDAGFMDAGGGGSLNVERLRLDFIKSGKPNIARTLHTVNMSAKVSVPDYQGKLVKKQYKNLITNVSAILCQNHQLAWPAVENNENSASDKDLNIIPQMRAYKVDKWNANGYAVYKSEIDIDHTLTAWQLAVYGCCVNTTGLVANNMPNVTAIASREQMPSEVIPRPNGQNGEQSEMKFDDSGKGPIKRSGTFKGWNSGGAGSRTKGFGNNGRRTW